MVDAAPHPFYIIGDGDRIVRIGLNAANCKGMLRHDNHPLLSHAAKELTEYLAGKRRQFTFPAATDFPPFPKMVYDRIQQIPYGEVFAIEELAAAVHAPASQRAIRALCQSPPLLICIPVHRIVDSDATNYPKDIQDVFHALRKMEKRFLLP